MPTIWFDVLTPKQVLFCRALAQRLEKQGLDIEYTTRHYTEVEGTLKLLDLEAEVIGRHGGGNRYQKLLASAERVVELAKYINKIRPDLGFAFASPESARVAFGLGIPYFTANDSPHSRFVAKLTIPFAQVFFTPWFMIPAWRKLDIPRNKIIPYHGLDPVAWLKGFMPNRDVLTELGLEFDQEFVLIRPEEAQASYLAGISDERNPVTNPIITQILDEFPDIKIVVLCRYPDQRQKMRERYGSQIILPDDVVDAPSLIALSTLLIGAGGTMNQEGCLLGVPVISSYPGKILETERFLTKKKLMYRITDPLKAAEKASQILKKRDYYQNIHMERASELFSTMEDPTEVISTWIQNYLEK
jgi:predicted glycosyltransferase